MLWVRIQRGTDFAFTSHPARPPEVLRAMQLQFNRSTMRDRKPKGGDQVARRKRHMAAVRRRLFIVLCSAAALAVLGSEAAAQSVLRRHVHQERREAEPLNRLPANQSLRLNIALPPRNEAELDDLLVKLNDPKSPFFHQFLTVQEFTDRFGPSEAEYAVVRFAEENGLTVTGPSANRMLVNVTAPVDRIERAFHVTIRIYQHPTEPRTFYGPDREPSVELGVPLWHITGLDNSSLPRPAGLSQVLTAKARQPARGRGETFSAAIYGRPIWRDRPHWLGPQFPRHRPRQQWDVFGA